MRSKEFFLAIGFTINWEVKDYIGFQKDECRFILQHFDQQSFAENFMLSVKVEDVTGFRDMVLEKQLTEKFGIRIGKITDQPYGKEVNLVDLAGVCWHFVES
jgi:hypothetical protein